MATFAKFSDVNHEREATAAEHVYITLFFERFEQGQRARALIESIASALRGQDTVELDMWQFDAEGGIYCLGESGRSAAKTQMLVVAADGEQPLPPRVTDWLDNWLANSQGKARLLVAFLEADSLVSGNTGLPFRCLQSLAMNHGLDFFAHIEQPALEQIQRR